MLNACAHTCVPIDVLFDVLAGTIVDMLAEVKVKLRTNVVVDLLIGGATDESADVFIDRCTDILVEIGNMIVAVAAAVIAVEFAVTVSCVGDFPVGMAVRILVNALAGVRTEVIVCAVPDIGVCALAEVNVDALASVMPAPLEKAFLFC